MFGSHVVLLALQKPGHRNSFTIVRPNTGVCVFGGEEGGERVIGRGEGCFA